MHKCIVLDEVLELFEECRDADRNANMHIGKANQCEAVYLVNLALEYFAQRIVLMVFRPWNC